MKEAGFSATPRTAAEEFPTGNKDLIGEKSDAKGATMMMRMTITIKMTKMTMTTTAEDPKSRKEME